MSRIRILLLVVFVSVLIASVAAADPAAPATTVPGPNAPAPESAALGPVPRGTVAALPIVITTPGTYTLDRDYLNLAGAIAIDVRCSNVVIDGGGHTLDGADSAGSVGIRVHGGTGLSGVTVKNIRVTDWGQGVHFWNAHGRIEGVTTSSNTGSGILIYAGGDATVITGCTAESNGAGGISISGAPRVEIESCTVRNNVDDGIYLSESNSSRITGTTVSGNTLSGIALLGGAGRITGAVVSGCGVSSNGKAGIYMSRAQSNTVVNNRFENMKNVLIEGTEIGPNTWSMPKTAGTNIVGGAWIGGNWWSGFSETAADKDRDGLADRAYAIGTGNSDALPLVSPAATDFTVRPGMVITVPGTYTLDEDLLDAEHMIVVEIRCSNVVIEGNGHRVSGGGQEGRCGIYAANATVALTGVVIRDLTVSNCFYGIYLVNADAGRIERCRIDDTPSNGMGLILARGSDGNTVTGNRVLAGPSAGPGTWGIVLASSSQNTITDNEFNNPVNAVLNGAGPNTWSGPKTAGTNIIGSAFIGGNYWAEPDGTGWSEQVADADHDGIGDSPYVLAAGNTDLLPLVGDRPDADFTAAPTAGTLPLQVLFTDTSAGSPASWAWSFGDGATSTLRSPNHTYAVTGAYTVSLTVRNAAGQADTETKPGMIAVSALPPALASIAPNTGVQGATVAITNLAGTGFLPGATVRFTRTGSAAIAATNVVAVSPTKITCRVALPPAAATGPWDVVVTNPDNKSATLTGGFAVSRSWPPGTNVTYTGQKIVITQPGSYVLTNDIMNSNLPTCIEIRASNVVFDGFGHLIDGLDTSQSTGFYVHGPTSAVSNVTIRNVRVQDWWLGIHLHGARNSRVETSNLSSNAFAGVIAYSNAVGNTITGSTIDGNNYGVMFTDGSTGGAVSDSMIAQNACGLYVYLSDGVSVTGNRIADNSNTGFELYLSGGGTISNNRFNNNVNVVFTGEPFKANTWSVTPGAAGGPNIMGGPRIGGNFWGQPDGTGFSQTHPDTNGDGFCDIALQIAEQNSDYYPLSANSTPTPHVVTVPGAGGVPTDTDADGRCDDVNGNGRKDFADIVLYFNQMSWIAANEPAASFDYNGNGRIDFADVVWLLAHL
ncbi:MAG: NosD domain-containing protein [Methanospirillum sp.]